MLQDEFKYYVDNQEELLKKHNGKIIVIVNKKVVGEFGSKEEAYLDSVKKFEKGTFLIIECTPGRDSYTIHQRSRVVA